MSTIQERADAEGKGLIDDLKKTARKFRAESSEAPLAPEEVDEDDEEEETPEVVPERSPKPSEDEPEDDESDEEEEDDDEEVEPEDKKLEERPQPQKRKTIYTEFNTLRTQSRKKDEELKSALDTIKDLTGKLQTLEKNQPPSQEIVSMAKEMGIEDPENLQKLTDAIVNAATKKTSESVSALAKEIDSLKKNESTLLEERQTREYETRINGEWEEITPSIAEAFPHATKEQLAQAKEVMIELAEDDKYSNQPMDYILFKEPQAFEDIFGPRKRKTMFSSKPMPRSEAKKPTGLFPKFDGTRKSALAIREKIRDLKSEEDFLEEDEDDRV